MSWRPAHNHETPELGVLRRLRAARRRHFVERLNLMEALYRAYVVAIFGGLGLALLAGAVHDAPLDPAALADLAERGPAVLGLLLAAAALAGLRSGARGGPLAIEAAEVQHVLLAPVERGPALRPAVLRQARVAVPAGAALGLAVAAFAVPRLPGSPVEWFAVLACFGALTPLCYLGPALLASGRRLGPATAAVAGFVLVAWSGADLLLGWKSSPASMLGALATLPLQNGLAAWSAAAGVALAVAVLLAGLAGIGGISLERARRRATLAAELRFSASVQDLRTVVLLRRQLASELPRPRPWLRARGLERFPAPVERRALRGFLRWPAARLGRVALLGALTGLVAAAVWAGTTPLAVAAGALLLLAALDLIEPLAQEIDHPTRRDLLPVAVPTLIGRHLVAPTIAVALVAALALPVALFTGASAADLLAGLAMLPGVAALLATAAALSATNDPYRYLLAPQLGYAQSAAPAVIAIVAAGLPLIAAREAVRHDQTPLTMSIVFDVVALFAVTAIVRFLGSRLAKSEGAPA